MSVRMHGILLMIAAVLAVSCSGNDSSQVVCTEASGQSADLCWAQRAEVLMATDSDGAIAAAEQIGDDRFHDIALLTIHKNLSEPERRVEACSLIRGEQAKKKCMTYEVRVHLWSNRKKGVPPPSESAAPKRTNRPECAGLSKQFRDACELEAVLSRAPRQTEADAVGVTSADQCMSIGDLEARAMCQTDIATQVSRDLGLDAGVDVCTSVETTLFRNDCLLRIRATHPEAPVARQQEICRLAGDLFGPCQAMITISGAAYLLQVHGEKPAVEALEAIDRDIRNYDGVLEASYGSHRKAMFKKNAGELTYLTMWFRVFARTIHARYRSSTDLIETRRGLVRILDHFDKTDPRRRILRAGLLRGFSKLKCRSQMRKQKAGVTVEVADWCASPSQLAEQFRQSEERLRKMNQDGSALQQPLYSSKLDTSDWWTVYKSDMGMVPRSFARNCAMSELEADELAAMSMISNGAWERSKDAFYAGLHSEYANVRSLTVHRLTKRLFNEWRIMPEQASTSAVLKTWLPNIEPSMRTHVQHLVDTVEQDTRSPARFSGGSWCPSPEWPN
jgi:hypothetical protein